MLVFPSPFFNSPLLSSTSFKNNTVALLINILVHTEHHDKWRVLLNLFSNSMLLCDKTLEISQFTRGDPIVRWIMYVARCWADRSTDWWWAPSMLLKHTYSGINCKWKNTQGLQSNTMQSNTIQKPCSQITRRRGLYC